MKDIVDVLKIIPASIMKDILEVLKVIPGSNIKTY